MYTLAIDPGKRTGVALFDGDLLTFATTVTSTEKDHLRRAVDVANRVVTTTTLRHPLRVVFEWPQIYTKLKGDGSDMLSLAAICGAIATNFRGSEIVSYKPREWKGQMTKVVCAERIRSRLSATEAKWLEGLPHDGVDAIGIGLKALGRFEPRRGV